MDPDHTYYLPVRDRIIGSLSADERVRELLRAVWSRHGHAEPGPFDGASFLPATNRARVTVSKDGEFHVLDVDPDTLEVIPR